MAENFWVSYNIKNHHKVANINSFLYIFFAVNIRVIIIARFLLLVTTMVTKVDQGNHRSNDRGNDRSNHCGYYDRYYNVNA